MPFVIPPALAWGALAGGGLTAGAAASLPDLFFGDVKENAKRELAGLNYDPTDGSRKRSLGDIIGETLLGRKEATDQAVKDLYVENLDNTYGINIGKIKRSLKNDGLDLSRLNITENTNAKKLKQFIAELNDKVDDRKSQLDIANLRGYGDEAALLPTNEITAMLRGKKKAEKTEEEGKLIQREKDLINLKREIARDASASTERMQTERILSSDKNALRTQELAILQAGNQNAARQDNAAFRRMQQQYNNRRLDMEQENINSKNRMQTIATLMQGLQGVAGAGNRVMPARSYYTL